VETIVVALGQRSYPIHIGPRLLGDVGLYGTAARQVLIVTNDVVAPLYLHGVEAALRGREVETVILPDGERHKTLATFSAIIDRLIDARFHRDCCLIALGGGVVGDLTGYVAASYQRGVDFVQVPTTLLAQVDSSVGGKTGINSAHGKNLIGVFYQPRLVLADTGVLDTLPPREFRAGYAEVVKYGLIDRPDFFGWLETNWRAVFAGGAQRTQAIAESCRAKADVVRRDEHETGDRALLNLGHTFGHALEAATAYDASRLVHGEAVAIGMVLAHRFSAHMNQASTDVARRVEAHLAAAGLPVALAQIPGSLPDAETLLDFIRQDKKVTRGTLTFILTHDVGEAFVAKDVPASAVLSFLKEQLAQ
jgi:3-dehydroquinate synthase